MVLAVDCLRTLDEVAWTYRYPGTMAAELLGWGWLGGAARAYRAPAGLADPPGGLAAVDADAHLFADPSGARQALDWSVDVPVVTGEATELSVGGGDDYTVRGFSATTPAGTEVTLVAQTGAVLVPGLSVASPARGLGDVAWLRWRSGCCCRSCAVKGSTPASRGPP